MTLSSGPRIGQCIYCGARRYSKDREKLGREHVVPRGLGGQWIILEASCQSCENIINRQAENICLSREMLGPLRYRLGLKPSGMAYLPVGIYHGPYVQQISVPIDEAPISIAMPVLPPPQIIKQALAAPIQMLKGPDMESPPPRNPYVRRIDDPDLLGLFGRIENDKVLALMARTNSRQIQPYRVRIYNDALFRMLAKIAHSYTVYELGGLTFRPFLQDLILGKKSRHPISHYVGGDPSLAEYIIHGDVRHRLSMMFCNTKIFGNCYILTAS